MSEKLHPLGSYRCKDDERQNCRTSCRKFMRGECDGRSAMLDAGGSWITNFILKRKMLKERGEIRFHVVPGDLPGNVKFVSSFEKKEAEK